MIADGYTGRKGKGGFYRLDQGGRRNASRRRSTSRPAPITPRRKPRLDARRRRQGRRAARAVRARRAGGALRLARAGRTLAYAAALVPEIADDIAAVDEAMRLGYNWKWGPFELIDRLGPAWFADAARGRGHGRAAAAAGRRATGASTGSRTAACSTSRSPAAMPTSPRPEGVLLLADVKRARPAGRAERLGEPVGHRRRRRLPRVPQQDERDRRRHARPARQGDRHRRARTSRRW